MGTAPQLSPGRSLRATRCPRVGFGGHTFIAVLCSTSQGRESHLGEHGGGMGISRETHNRANNEQGLHSGVEGREQSSPTRGPTVSPWGMQGVFVSSCVSVLLMLGCRAQNSAP